MIAGWAFVLAALVYLCTLFAVAHYGDTSGRRWIRGPARGTIYALTLAVYCTSWTFFGSVGLATRSGVDFLAVYVGPILMIGLGYGLVSRVVRLAKSQNITSIADFVAARYGKSERVAAIVCIVAVIGSVPYISLQLKAISSSLTTVLGRLEGSPFPVEIPFFGDLALFVALILAGFTIAFGTRHIDATEHQDGLMLAVAMESVVKLIAFLTVGITVTYFAFGGFGDLLLKATNQSRLAEVTEKSSPLSTFVAITVLSAFASLLLPRQFHTAVVENRDVRDVKRAAWTFPAYLVAINIFVLPLALAGLLAFPEGTIDRDMTVLALPLAEGYGLVTLIAFLGGLSAATAMVIVDCVALSIMISNDLVMPVLVRRRGLGPQPASEQGDAAREPGEAPADLPGDLGGTVLIARRIAIFVLLFMGYIYYRAAGDAALASIGLISFAAIAQIGPAFLGGLFWRRGTAAGATAGLVTGLLVWAYTLFLPSFVNTPALSGILAHGLFGQAFLRPTSLFGFDDLQPLTHGVFWSLIANVTAYVGFSLLRPATPIERLQANAFVGSDSAPMGQALRLWRSSISVRELKGAIARYLGEERTERSFASFAEQRGIPLEEEREADIHTLRFGEHLLASAIGAASSRLVLSLLLRRRNVSTKAALKLLDDASAALQYNRDILQNALDHARQGITVFDRDLQLMCWNREYGALFNLPPDMIRVGVGLDEIIRYNAERGIYGHGPSEQIATARLESFIHDTEPVRLRLYPDGRVIEIRSSHIPDGGIVTTYTEITAAVQAEQELEAANETLERRVRERTEELTRVNNELSRAKARADEANVSKTRFLAAASHDILQPLNAARLYATSLVERDRQAGDATLAENVDASLEAVEEILTALLEISRLDSGSMRSEFTSFRLDEILRQLQREFEPLAQERQVSLVFVPTSVTVRSDRRLIRRLLQNLISNAIKYSPSGKVLVGCRRRKTKVRIEVHDTGLGIPASKQKVVFREFQRLDQGAKTARGLGLGLSIVERIARVLDHPIKLNSESGKGSTFSVEVPVSAPLPALATQPVAQPTVSAPLAGFVVLAIDNEPAILDGMSTLLGGWGCVVLTAANAKEALQTIRRVKLAPNAVIADYHLDEGDGIDAIVKLRWKFGHALPAVLLTADRTASVRDEAVAKEIQVLNKPLRPAALRSLLAQWRVTRAAAE